MTDLGDWTSALERRFEAIGRQRLQGLGLLHPGLRVQALGWRDAADGSAWGVLITPWFLNLLRRPSPGDVPLPVGRAAVRTLGEGHELEFLGAHDEVIGAYEAVSLFSPMHAFADHAAAVVTAWEVLGLLRRPVGADEDRGTPMRAASGTGTASGSAQATAPAKVAGDLTASASTASTATSATGTASATVTSPARAPAPAGSTLPPSPGRRGLLFGRGQGARA